MLRHMATRFGRTARILPVLGLMTTLLTASPALADVAPASSPGPLAITQTATGTETIGQIETFTITVTNTTTGVASDVFLGDALPIGARLTGPLPNPNFCAKGGFGGTAAFACLVGTLAPGASFSITFQVIPSTPGTMVNRAATTGFAGGSFTTNSVTLVVPVASGGVVTPVSAAADVQVTGFASTGAPTAGSTYGYVFQVRNNGPQTATGVTFNDALPSGLSYVGSANSATGLCSFSAGTVSCSLGDLAVGATALVGIQVTAPTGLPFGTPITNVGTVTSTSADSNLNNNSFPVTVRIQ